MKKLLIAPALFLALMLMGCPQQPYQTPYPVIETGIYLTQLQMDLQQHYLELYQFVSAEEQAFMEKKIAPLINNMKHRVHLYNQAVLMDQPPEYTEAEIRLLARQIIFKISEVTQ